MLVNQMVFLIHHQDIMQQVYNLVLVAISLDFNLVLFLYSIIKFDRNTDGGIIQVCARWKLLDNPPATSNLNPLICSTFLVTALTLFIKLSKIGGLLGLRFLN